MIYSISQIISTLSTASKAMLKVEGIDAINPAIGVDANYQLPPSVVYDPNLINSSAPPFVTVPGPGLGNGPIYTGGIPHGIAAQTSPNPTVVYASGTEGDFIPINLKALLPAARDQHYSEYPILPGRTGRDR